jgi:ParB family chromosome partitioning protein
VIERGLSVRATEALVRRLLSGKGGRRAGGATEDPDIRRLENQLSETLGAGVSIRHQKKTGRGRVEIRYSSLTQLDGILSKIK